MMKFLAFIILMYCLVDRCHCGSLSPIQLAEQTLINSLLNGYNKNIRPADQVSVAITATLRQLVGTDEKQQIMTSSSFISQRWFDNRLSWDPSNSSNITVVMLPVKNLWTPDTMVLNSADTSGYFTISDSSLASVRYDGEVYMILPALGIRTRCRFNLQQFPFDRQICSINLTSWAQGTNRITYAENSTLLIDISEYSENSLWKLTGTHVVVYHAGDRSPFEDTYTDVISIQLYLQRKPLFYLVNGIYACLITNCATLVAYAITFGPQIALCMSCFKIYSVYALNFSSVFPQQSEYVMKITLFFLLSITWTFISMVWFTVYNYLVTKGEMPEWLYDFCDHLQRMFSCSPPTKADGKTKKKKDISAENGKHQKSGDQQIVALHTQRHTGFENIDNPVDVRPIEVAVDSSVNRTIEMGKPKCDFCNRCESCQADFDKNKAKNKSKKDIEAKCNALNNLAFSCVLLLMFSSNMVLWLSISQ